MKKIKSVIMFKYFNNFYILITHIHILLFRQVEFLSGFPGSRIRLISYRIRNSDSRFNKDRTKRRTLKPVKRNIVNINLGHFLKGKNFTQKDYGRMEKLGLHPRRPPKPPRSYLDTFSAFLSASNQLKTPPQAMPSNPPFSYINSNIKFIYMKNY